MVEDASMAKFCNEGAWTPCTVNKQAYDLPWFHGMCFKAALAASLRCRFFYKLFAIMAHVSKAEC